MITDRYHAPPVNPLTAARWVGSLLSLAVMLAAGNVFWVRVTTGGGLAAGALPLAVVVVLLPVTYFLAPPKLRRYYGGDVS